MSKGSVCVVVCRRLVTDCPKLCIGVYGMAPSVKDPTDRKSGLYFWWKPYKYRVSCGCRAGGGGGVPQGRACGGGGVPQGRACGGGGGASGQGVWRGGGAPQGRACVAPAPAPSSVHMCRGTPERPVHCAACARGPHVLKGMGRARRTGGSCRSFPQFSANFRNLSGTSFCPSPSRARWCPVCPLCRGAAPSGGRVIPPPSNAPLPRPLQVCSLQFEPDSNVVVVSTLQTPIPWGRVCVQHRRHRPLHPHPTGGQHIPPSTSRGTPPPKPNTYMHPHVPTGIPGMYQGCVRPADSPPPPSPPPPPAPPGPRFHRRRNANHLEERLLDQAQRASFTPPFWRHLRSIPQGMLFDVQPLVKSLFCPMKRSPNGFFDSEASIP